MSDKLTTDKLLKIKEMLSKEPEPEFIYVPIDPKMIKTAEKAGIEVVWLIN